MINHFLSIEFFVLILAMSLIIECEKIVKDYIGNPYEGIMAIRMLPRWLISFIMVTTHQYVIVPALLILLVLSFFSSPWYVGLIAIPVAVYLGNILSNTRIISSILGFKILASIGILWVPGFVFYAVGLF